MYSMTRSRHDGSLGRLGLETAAPRRLLVLIAAVMALVMLTAFVYLLTEVVAGGERTRESWRATEMEKVSARATARDQRPSLKR